MPKEYYLYVNGQKVKVSEQIYKVYWREREHEKYLEQVDKKNHLLFFSSLDHDGHFADSIIDESVDVEKIVETQMMIEVIILGYFEPPVRVFGATVPEKGSHEFRCSRATFVPCL